MDALHVDVDAKPVMEHARAIKSQQEIHAFQRSLATCEASIAAMREALHPGMTESEALGILLRESVSRGGEYPETRLLTSGPRTNLWFQETSDRVMHAREDAEWGAYDGVFEENMVVCVESYIGEVGGDEGVKLEQPVWISADGPVVLSSYPLEDAYA